MDYIKRHGEKTVRELAEMFGAVLVSGARQVGKTTILKELTAKKRGKKITYTSLDSAAVLKSASEEAETFFEYNPPPVFVDEIQYAPELFTYIKIHTDKAKKDGLFWLTGSQKYKLMKGVQESLAGRVAILDMLGFSFKEIAKKPKDSKPFLPSLNPAKKIPIDKSLTSSEVYKIIWQGSFPRIIAKKSNANIRNVFFSSYIQTYIQRDVKDFYKIDNELAFHSFLIAVAARTGQLLNYSNLADDAHIDLRTAKLWLEILERSGIIHLLYPYSSNIAKRVIKTPKLYFLDTGLASYLCSWDTADSLRNGAQNGAMLETYIFAEILKSYWHSGEAPNIYFYRDTDQKEIDFIIEKNMTLYPIEVKKTANPNQRDHKSFDALSVFKKPAGTGAVICLYDKITSIGKNVITVPVWEI